MSNEEFILPIEIKILLKSKHCLFEAFTNTVVMYYSTEIKTLAVTYSENNDVSLLVNKSFFDTLTVNQKLFVLCHEAMHILYLHGVRGKNLNQNIANIAMDLVINEELVLSHGFNRLECDPKNDYVWNDKYFPTETFMFKSFEYYYDRLLKNEDVDLGDNNLDSHEGLTNIKDNDLSEIVDNIVDEMKRIIFNSKPLDDVNVMENLNDEELLKSKITGTGPGSELYIVPKTTATKNKKFYKLILNKSHSIYKEKISNDWSTKPRRTYTMDNEILIPNEKEIELKTKDKCNAYVFLDTSGSCISFKQYFWKVALTIPKDKFNIHLYCFDTSVYKTDFISRRLYGFGGTSFNCIDHEINSIKKHPDVIFVITDGYGTHIKPLKPEKWVWLLTSGSTKTYIPNESEVFYLKDFDL